VKIGYVNLFLQTAADGSAEPLFPGGAIVQRLDYNAPGLVLPDPTGAISWERPDGSVAGLVANVRRTVSGNQNVTYLVAEGGEGQDTSSRVVVRAVPPDGVSPVAEIQIQSIDGAAGAGSFITAFAGASPALTVVDGARNSHFLQNTAARRLMFSDVRSTGGVAFPAGPTLFGVPIDTTGVGTVLGILVVNLTANVHWNFDWFPNVPGSQIVVVNRDIAQTVTFDYLVFGRG
jgi:hypothetical protein